jgi:hypothetical protein
MRPFSLIFDDKDNGDVQLPKLFYMGEELYYETQHSNYQHCNDRDRLYHRAGWGQFIHSRRKRNGTRQHADANWRNCACPWIPGSGYCHLLVSD